jgi:hypothetical protein
MGGGAAERERIWKRNCFSRKKKERKHSTSSCVRGCVSVQGSFVYK